MILILRSVIIFLGLPLLAFATELSPWYPRIFEIQPLVEYHSLHSKTVASSHGDFRRRLNANFLHGSISAAYYEWYGEAEVLLADDTQRSFGYDSATATVRYQLSDDVPGDSFFSSVIGFSLRSAGRQALNDLSSFHHGKIESLIHLSVGKEFSYGQDWSSRFWGALGLGCADVGSPWIFFRLSGERKYCVNHQLGLFVDGLFGLGGNSLSKHKHFHGYGPIDHHSIDISAAYSYLFEYGSKASLGGSYRVYARNFPKKAYCISISFLYPFGL